MPDRLTTRATLLLVGLAFGLTFCVHALLSGGSSAAEPAATRSSAAPVAEAPAAQPDLRLVAAGTVPALREPQRPRRRRAPARKPKRTVRKVVKAVQPSPVMRAAPVRPVPTAAPRYVPPAPRYVPPAPRRTPVPKPKATPAPTSSPQTSGDFDSSGEP